MHLFDDWLDWDEKANEEQGNAGCRGRSEVRADV